MCTIDTSEARARLFLQKQLETLNDALENARTERVHALRAHLAIRHEKEMLCKEEVHVLNEIHTKIQEQRGEIERMAANKRWSIKRFIAELIYEISDRIFGYATTLEGANGLFSLGVFLSIPLFLLMNVEFDRVWFSFFNWLYACLGLAVLIYVPWVIHAIFSSVRQAYENEMSSVEHRRETIQRLARANHPEELRHRIFPSKTGQDYGLNRFFNDEAAAYFELRSQSEKLSGDKSKERLLKNKSQELAAVLDLIRGVCIANELMLETPVSFRTMLQETSERSISSHDQKVSERIESEVRRLVVKSEEAVTEEYDVWVGGTDEIYNDSASTFGTYNYDPDGPRYETQTRTYYPIDETETARLRDANRSEIESRVRQEAAPISASLHSILKHVCSDRSFAVVLFICREVKSESFFNWKQAVRNWLGEKYTIDHWQKHRQIKLTESVLELCEHAADEMKSDFEATIASNANL